MQSLSTLHKDLTVVMNKCRGMINTVFRGKKAWIANMVVGGGLFAAGDLLEQSLEIRYGFAHHYSLTRTARMTFVGMLVGPAHQLVYWALEKWYPGKSMRVIWKKVFLDQIISCPVFHIHFFMGMAIMEGKSIGEAWGEFLRKFPTVYLVDLVFWTPCQLITFYFIPLNYRVLFTNTLTMIWNIFLSYMKHYVIVTLKIFTEDQHEDPRIAECCRKGTCSCHLNENPLVLLADRLIRKTNFRGSQGDKFDK